MDAVNVALQLAFIAIFIAVLVRYLRQPRAVQPRPHVRLRVRGGAVRGQRRPEAVAGAAARDQLAIGRRAPAPAVSDLATGAPFRPGVEGRGTCRAWLVPGRDARSGHRDAGQPRHDGSWSSRTSSPSRRGRPTCSSGRARRVSGTPGRGCGSRPWRRCSSPSPSSSRVSAQRPAEPTAPIPPSRRWHGS